MTTRALHPLHWRTLPAREAAHALRGERVRGVITFCGHAVLLAAIAFVSGVLAALVVALASNLGTSSEHGAMMKMQDVFRESVEKSVFQFRNVSFVEKESVTDLSAASEFGALRDSHLFRGAHYVREISDKFHGMAVSVLRTLKFSSKAQPKSNAEALRSRKEDAQ